MSEGAWHAIAIFLPKIDRPQPILALSTANGTAIAQKRPRQPRVPDPFQEVVSPHPDNESNARILETSGAFHTVTTNRQPQSSKCNRVKPNINNPEHIMETLTFLYTTDRATPNPQPQPSHQHNCPWPLDPKYIAQRQRDWLSQHTPTTNSSAQVALPF